VKPFGTLRVDGASTAVSLLGDRLIAGMRFGVEPTDAWSLGAVGLVLGVFAVLACAAPVRRAVEVVPAQALCPV